MPSHSLAAVCAALHQHCIGSLSVVSSWSDVRLIQMLSGYLGTHTSRIGSAAFPVQFPKHAACP